jgi:transcriptional regulator GlxA family with amidase domain
MKTILILAFDGVMDSSLAITLDILQAAQAFAAQAGKPDSLRVLTAGHKKFIHTRANLRMTVDLTFKELPDSILKPDWIVIPGWGLRSEQAIAGRLAKRDAMEAMSLLQNADRGSAKIGASCSSVFLLAQAGLLDGRQATMTWWLARIFRAHYPNVKLDETKMLARDGKYLTSGSAFSQLDLVLAIVTETLGAATADLCMRYLLIEQRPSQAPYMVHTHTQQVDPTVIAAERWIDANLSKPISVIDLSSQLAVSPKTLGRRIEAATGVSPIKFIQRRRLLHASHLIKTTSMSIDAIAEKVGYQDGTALRKLVKREFGTTPAALR